MAKKFFIFILMLLMFITPVYADSASSSFNGTASSCKDEFVLVDYYITGKELENFKGTIKYDAGILKLFDYRLSDLSNWSLSMNADKDGEITFSGEMSDDAIISTSLINSQTKIVSLRFVLLTDSGTSTSVTATGVTSTKTVDVEDKSKIVNQSDIDEARMHNTAESSKKDLDPEYVPDIVEVPDPIYGSKPQTTTTKFKDVKHVVKISKKLSSNAYLKSLSIPNGTLSPSFTKLNKSYNLSVNANDTINVNAVAENPNSSVDVKSEANNQIVISVTAEDGTIDNYILNVERTEVVTPDQKEPQDPNKKSGFSLNVTNKTTLIFLILIGVIALGFIGIGSYYVYIGSHIEVYDDE